MVGKLFVRFCNVRAELSVCMTQETLKQQNFNFKLRMAYFTVFRTIFTWDGVTAPALLLKLFRI